MPRTWSLILIGLLGARFGAESSAQPQTDEQAAQRMARYNVVWTSPSKDASGVMPIGNGSIGAGVYAIENGDLYLLLSKEDAFSYSGNLYKTGRLRVSLNPNPFVAGKAFCQTLDLPTASIRIDADGMKLRIWADANRPIYHAEIDSPRDISVAAQWESFQGCTQWRGLDPTPYRGLTRGNSLLWYFAVGDKSHYRGALEDNSRKAWTIEDPEKILPDLWRFNTFGNLAESPGLTVSNGVLAGQGRKFDLHIHAYTKQTPDINAWVQGMEELAARPVELEKDWEQHCRWWRDFWDRGWIIASDRTVPADQRERLNGECNAKGFRGEADGAALVAQSYNVFRFFMGAQSRGRFQTRFNGGLFTQQQRLRPERVASVVEKYGDAKKLYPTASQLPDGSWISGENHREWAPFFTSQNQRLLYWPLLMSGDFDLMQPFFDHFWNLLEMRKLICRKYFGHGGAYYRENMCPVTGTDGWTPPPKTKPGEKHDGNYFDYYFTSGLEMTAVMTDYVNYTGDTKFRDERLVPFAREIILFYDQHYPRGADGKLLLDPSQALETWWVTVNSAPDVAGLCFCLDQLLAMKAGTAEDQSNWKRLQTEMPEVPLHTIERRQALAPAAHWEKQHNGENAELYPVFPFRCYGFALGTKEIVGWTMQHRTCQETFGGMCWTQDQIGWALAGNAAEAAKGLIRRFRYATTNLRFPLYGNDYADGTPDFDHFGSGAIALQRMLVQEGRGTIYLLPAWPAEWDADFKLHLEGGTVLTGTVKDGKLLHWECAPAARLADVVVCGPAPTQGSAGH
ncbi:MAG: DUF5703 domain-containing protein [Planctomycetota bacterium]|nr:DUF5703 domain-containing protein [Planctomycetota bacterium]